MKTIYKSIFAALFIFVGLNAHSQITIGSGTETTMAMPVYPWYEYSYSQCIYLSSEINASGTITSIKYYTTTGANISNANNWTVYMGHTTKNVFDNNNDWVPTSNLTQVFTGIVTNVGDEVTITLDVPFAYNGTDNLLIAVDENAPSWNGSGDRFYQSSVGSTRGLNYYADGFNFDPNAMQPGNAYAGIANVTLDMGVAPACSTPNQLGTSNVTSNSADLTWSENGTANTWNIEWGTQGFIQGTGTMVSGTQDNPYALSGLASSTNYSFYVQSDCGVDGTSNWSDPYNFTTLCAAVAISSFPWSEDFDALIAPELPCGWSIENVDADATEWGTLNIISNSAPNGLGVGNFSSSPLNDWVFTPEFTFVTGQEYVLSFNHRVFDSAVDEKLKVAFGTSAINTAMTEIIFDEVINSTMFIQETINFTPSTSGSYYIGFYAYSDPNSNAIIVDDVVVDISSCSPPSSATISQNANTLSVIETGTTYQWVDCNNSNAPISGENAQDFDVTVSGDYAVMLFDGGCYTISACENITVTGVEAINKNQVSAIYPNPVSNGHLTIQSKNEINEVKIVDAIGKTVYSNKFNNQKQINIDLTSLNKGVYFIQLNNEVQKLIIE